MQNEKSNKNEEHYVQTEEMFKTENEFCPFPVKNVKKCERLSIEHQFARHQNYTNDIHVQYKVRFSF